MRRAGWERGDAAELLAATTALIAVRLGLALLPLRTVQRAVIAVARSGAPSADGSSAGDASIERSVRRAARLVPGSKCLPMAFAGLVLTGRRGHRARVQIGVRRQPDEPFGAHAWLETPRGVTIGGDEASNYAPLLTIDPFAVE